MMVLGREVNIVVGVTLLSVLGDFKRLARILIGAVRSMGEVADILLIYMRSH